MSMSTKHAVLAAAVAISLAGCATTPTVSIDASPQAVRDAKYCTLRAKAGMPTRSAAVEQSYLNSLNPYEALGASLSDLGKRLQQRNTLYRLCMMEQGYD